MSEAAPVEGTGAGEAATGRLLWEACRRRPDPTALRRAVEARPDPAVVFSAAMVHGLVPMLWRALCGAGVGDAMGEWAERFDQVTQVRRLEAMLLLPRAVAQAVVPLTDIGLEPLVFKGPVVAARYPEPGMRAMEDLDLYLPRRQHGAALAALERAGWDVVRPAAYDRYDRVLRHPDVPALVLELHYGFEAWYKRVTAVDAEELWRRRVPVDCLGTSAFGLPPAEEIVALAQHAGKPFHSFTRLVWIADLGMVVGDCEERERGPGIDWDAVRALAEAGRCTTVVRCALAMAARIGVDAPVDRWGSVGPPWRAASLARLVDDGWPLRCGDEEAFDLRFALADSALRRLGLLVGSRYVRSEVGFGTWALDVPGETMSRCLRWRRSRRCSRPGGPGLLEGVAGAPGAPGAPEARLVAADEDL